MSGVLLRPNRVWILFIIVFAFCSALALAYFARFTQQSGLKEDASVPIGGPFQMIDHSGELVSDQDFLGKPTLYYFGFTFCPDVCPTQLVELSDALDILRVKTEDINFVFVTVDPSRDTPEVMSQYVSAFHPNLIGLTGTEQQVANMAKAYRIFYRVIERPDSPENYSVDHSAFTYLVGPHGKYITHFSHGATADQIVTVLRDVL